MPDLGGRPTIFSDELATKICELIANGKTLRKICDIDGMPGTTTVVRWLTEAALPEASEGIKRFRAQYTQARQDQADYFADEMIDLADGETNPDRTGILRVQVDVRKWHASKTAPKKYGEKLEINSGMSQEELARKVAEEITAIAEKKRGK